MSWVVASAVIPLEHYDYQCGLDSVFHQSEISTRDMCGGKDWEVIRSYLKKKPLLLSEA